MLVMFHVLRVLRVHDAFAARPSAGRADTVMFSVDRTHAVVTRRLDSQRVAVGLGEMHRFRGPVAAIPVSVVSSEGRTRKRQRNRGRDYKYFVHGDLLLKN